MKNNKTGLNKSGNLAENEVIGYALFIGLPVGKPTVKPAGKQNKGVCLMRKLCVAFIFTGLFALTVLLGAGCASGAGGYGSRGSEVIIRRVDSNSMVKLRVHIDGKSAGTLKVGGTARYKLKNGIHTIYATAFDYVSRRTEVSQFASNNSRHVFSITDTSIVFIGQEPMSISGPPMITPNSGISTLDAAVKVAFDGMARTMKKKSRVAIINIASDNRAEGTYAIEELTSAAVNSPLKLKVIDRRKIESIRIAKNFDRTSDMEDDFVLSIGHLLGADVVITGNLNGQGDLRRLRVKAIDVRTAVLVGMYSGKV
jgi:hypothetical protein